MIRTTCNLLLLASLLLWPWWISLLLAFYFSFLFEEYFEVMPAALLVDLLYTPTSYPGWAFSLGIIVFAGVATFKRRLRLYV